MLKIRKSLNESEKKDFTNSLKTIIWLNARIIAGILAIHYLCHPMMHIHDDSGSIDAKCLRSNGSDIHSVGQHGSKSIHAGMRM